MSGLLRLGNEMPGWNGYARFSRLVQEGLVISGYAKLGPIRSGYFMPFQVSSC